MTWRFGKTSESELTGVKPRLSYIARRALELSDIDFAVHEGVRDLARQKELYASGASRTLDSFHLTGHAVDLVPYVSGRLQWQMPLCIRIARAMHAASREHQTPIVWGAVWDCDLGSLAVDYLPEHVEEYIERFRKRNPDRYPLIDGPHYQMRRS